MRTWHWKRTNEAARTAKESWEIEGKGMPRVCRSCAAVWEKRKNLCKGNRHAD